MCWWTQHCRGAGFQPISCSTHIAFWGTHATTVLSLCQCWRSC